ncbi:MAG: response regulator, partial [Desulfobacterales bacterium]|nr:response regulator [Desulfobacterales bacterium]
MQETRATILLVDDDPDVLAATTRVLSRDGYRVITAEGGIACLNQAPDLAPDLILLDAVMPDLTGLEVCRQLKTAPSTRHIPVILISSMKIESDDQAEGLETGADDYITRPIKNRELLARIRAFLRLRAVEKKLATREKLLSAVVDNIDASLYIVDRQMRVSWINARTARELGKTESEILGEKCFHLFGEGDAPCPGCPVLKTVNTKTGASAILSFPGSRIKHATTHPLTDDRGRLQGVLKIDTDITDRKQNEAELDLRVHVKKLEEKNIALNVLLETRDDQRHQIADTIWQNFDRLVCPYHEKLREGRPKDLDTLVKILEKNTIE